jgi:hypothetical protein
MKPLYIFDIDGTLADPTHRLPLLLNGCGPDRWRQFYAACGDDKPIMPTIITMHGLITAGADVWLFSGRSDEVRDKTIQWLQQHVRWTGNPAELVMRRQGDYRADHIVKKEFYDRMLLDDRERLIAIFDDRQQVVDMWRRQGITCYQVADGKF